MSRGTTYLGLLANLKQEDMLYEARKRARSTTPVRRRPERGPGLTLLQRLRLRPR
jgi:hypothetical protein